MESPFEVLGIAPDADEAAIERAYRERVKETHPDLGGSREAFLRVRSAYEAITSGEWAAGENGEAPSHDGARAWSDAAPGWNGYDGTGSDQAGTGDGDPDGQRTTVEFLDFDVLVDHGWAMDDDDLFEKAAAADLDQAEHGRLSVPRDAPLLDAAESCGLTWPYACRGGACANCAVAVTEGDLDMPVNHVLPEEMTRQGFRLSCIGTPTSEALSVVVNVKHRPDLDDLRLPPTRFERANAGD